MTVAPVVPDTVYQLTGANLGPFNTAFPYAASSDVLVFLDLADGNGPALLSAPGDYTIADLIPLTTGGALTLNVGRLPAGGAWAAGAVLAMRRATPQQSTYDPAELGGFSPTAAAQAIDNLERQIQDLKALVGLSLRLPDGDSASPVLPTLAARKGKLAAFDGVSGDVIATTLGAVAPLPQTVLTFADAPALRIGGTVAGYGAIALLTGADANRSGGGVFVCKQNNGMADDGVDVIVAGTNRWVRQADAATPIGAVGDGVADDTAALQAWLDAPGLYKVLPKPQPGSQGYLISNTLVWNGAPGAIEFTQPTLFHCGGGNLIAAAGFAGSYMVEFRAPRAYVHGLALNGGKDGAGGNNAFGGLRVASSRSRFHDLTVTHCYGRCVAHDSVGDVSFTYPVIEQWSNGDEEYAVHELWTADGWWINHADIEIIGGITRWCGRCLHFGPDAGTTWVRGHHPYNGGQNGLNAPLAVTSVAADGVHVTYNFARWYMGATPAVGSLVNIAGFGTAGYNATNAPVTASGPGFVTVANTQTGATGALGTITTGARVDPTLVSVEPGAAGIFLDACYLDKGKINLYSQDVLIYNCNHLQSTGDCVFSDAVYISLFSCAVSHPFLAALATNTMGLAANNLPLNAAQTIPLAIKPGPAVPVTSVPSADGTHVKYGIGTAVTAGAYNQTNGQITLTTAAAHRIPVGARFGVSLTATGADAKFASGTFVALPGTAGTTLIYQHDPGKTITAITGGTAGLWTDGARDASNTWSPTPPQFGDVVIAGFGTGGYNTSATGLVPFAADATSVTLANTQTGATGALGTAQYDYLGDPGALSALLTENTSKVVELNGGVVHVLTDIKGNSARAVVQTVQSITETFSAQNPTNPATVVYDKNPVMTVTVNRAQFKHPVTGQAAQVQAGSAISNTAACTVAGDGTHVTYTRTSGTWAATPAVGSQISAAGYVVGGYNVTGQTVTGATSNSVSIAGATVTADATVGTVTLANDSASLQANGDGSGSLKVAGSKLVDFTTTSFYPDATNTVALGRSDKAWQDVFTHNAVTVTSDARSKADIAPLDAGAARAFVAGLTPRSFRFKVGGHDDVRQIWRDPWGEPVSEDWIGYRGADGARLDPASVHAVTRLPGADAFAERGHGKDWFGPGGQPAEEVRARDAELVATPRAGRRRHLGFLAHEVRDQAAAAGFADFAGFVLADPADPESGQAVRPDQLVPALWRAVQDQIGEIDALKARLAALEVPPPPVAPAS